MKAYGDKISHFFSDVGEVAAGEGWCHIQDKRVTLPKADVLVSGPSCTHLSRERRDAAKYVGCYEDEHDKADCESGATYRFGYRDALTTLGCKVGFYENVKSVLNFQKNEAGQLIRPAADVIKEHSKERGYAFECSAWNSQDFLLRHRRERAWGSSSFGEPDQDDYASRMEQTMGDMRSCLLFSHEDSFDASLPRLPYVRCPGKEKGNTGRLSHSVNQARALARDHGDDEHDLFVDASTSEGRNSERGLGVLCCIRPSHAQFSTKLGRFVTGPEFLRAQGVWKCDMGNPDALTSLEDQGLSQSFAGKAFSATVLQAKLLSSLIHSHGWRVIAAEKKGCATQIPAPRPVDVSVRMSAGRKRTKSAPTAETSASVGPRGASSGPVATAVPEKPEHDPTEQAVETQRKRGNNTPGDPISIWKKVEYIKMWKEMKNDPDCSCPSLEMYKKKLPGVYKGCFSKSRWLRTCEKERWELFCDRCPCVAKKKDQVPLWRLRF